MSVRPSTDVEAVADDDTSSKESSAKRTEAKLSVASVLVLMLRIRKLQCSLITVIRKREVALENLETTIPPNFDPDIYIAC